MYKISIIMPVYNGENDLNESISSILNQTIGLNDIEVIFIDDKSTDNTYEILKEYCSKYPNFKLISLKENVGAAYGPRNIGLEAVQGEFVMFLDSDDKIYPDACESLYNTINSNNDIDFVFGRYLRVYPEDNLKFKGHSPYNDSLLEYEDDLTNGFQFNFIVKFLWKHIISRLIYPKKEVKGSIIVIDDISENMEVLTILPSIWTKIYRTSFIKKYDLKFPPYISGEDLNFLLESFFKAKRVVFLNNHIVHEYYMRKGSVTKNIKYSMVYDSIKSYYNAVKILNTNNFKKPSLVLNPFLLNWISLYFKSNLEKTEKKELLNVIHDLEKCYYDGFISKFLIFLIKILLKI